MNISNLPKERRLILIIGAIVLLLGVVYRFSPTLGRMAGDEDEIQLKKKKVEKYSRMVKTKKQHENNLLSLTRNLERAEAGLIRRETPALAAVYIQNMVTDALNRAGLQTNKIQVIKPVAMKDAPYLRIGIQVRFTSNVEQLKQILYRIESYEKILRVRQLQLNRSNPRDQGETSIKTDMVVEGMMYMNDETTGNG